MDLICIDFAIQPLIHASLTERNTFAIPSTDFCDALSSMYSAGDATMLLTQDDYVL